MRLKPCHILLPDTVLELRIPGTLPIPMQDLADLRLFMQAMLNRAGVGNLRYGAPASRKKYMRRLALELAAYRKTGNGEHLFNIAVYAWLETVAPQHKHQHFNMAAESVTRGKLGGNIA